MIHTKHVLHTSDVTKYHTLHSTVDIVMHCPDPPSELKALFPQLHGMWLVAHPQLLVLFGIISTEEMNLTQGYLPFPG